MSGNGQDERVVEVVVLGSGTPIPTPDRAGLGLAVVDDPAWALVDCGRAITQRALRRAEVVDGGELVVSTLVADPAYVAWMEVVEAGVQDPVSDGRVTADEHDHMVVPTYLHELADLLTPVTSQDAGFELVDHVPTVAPDPAFAAYRDHRDAAR